MDEQPQQRPPKNDGAAGGTLGQRPEVACPFCDSREVELLSLFGSQLSTDQYYCRACRTPFERFKHDEEE